MINSHHLPEFVVPPSRASAIRPHRDTKVVHLGVGIVRPNARWIRKVAGTVVRIGITVVVVCFRKVAVVVPGIEKLLFLPLSIPLFNVSGGFAFVCFICPPQGTFCSFIAMTNTNFDHLMMYYNA